MAADSVISSELLTWGAIIGSGGSIAALVSFWMKLGGRLTKSEERSTVAEQDVKENSRKVDELARDFKLHQVDSAKESATVRALAEQASRSIVDAEHRLAVAISEIGQALRHMTERFDAFIGGAQSMPRRRHR